MPEFDRRAMLGGLLAAGAVAMSGDAALAARPVTFFRRVGLPIGLQLYMLGDDAGKDIDATFAQVAAIGYRAVELAGLYGRTPAEVRASADRAGLTIGSIHVPPVMQGIPGAGGGLNLGSPPAAIAEALGTLGTRLAVLPIAPFPDGFRPRPGEAMQAALGRTFVEAGAEHWHRVAAVLNERGAALRTAGIALGYHNHNVEFAPIPASGGKGMTSGWDILVRELDPASVHFELDVGWVASAGHDPVAVLRRLRGRVREMHVKDVAAGNTVNFALGTRPTEVGSGTLDWARILPAAHAAGVRHFYVEQEPPYAIPRIEAARKSHDFLAALRA